ncbi:MAG: alpha/beta hydrolase [Methylobacteriaceae bacterium]|nr:alpha/beta hydrolase [Methylobacteriaceae bacterium]
MANLSFLHRYEPGTAPGRRPLLLLHGTGGDETDLLPVGRLVAPGAPLLSPRGQVLEHGMPRFFRRLSEGVFDEADVRRRALDLAAFVQEAKSAYGIESPVAVGFSNGANIAAALLMLQPEILAGAALLRAMAPLSNPPDVDLSGKPVLMLSGNLDPIVPPASASALAGQLERAGATLRLQTVPGGHGLTQTDLALTQRWLDDTPDVPV